MLLTNSVAIERVIKCPRVAKGIGSNLYWTSTFVLRILSDERLPADSKAGCGSRYHSGCESAECVTTYINKKGFVVWRGAG
jgi:hypothetical protein